METLYIPQNKIESVLIVDDEVIGDYLVDSIQKGFRTIKRCDTAKSYEECIEFINTHSYEIMIVDINLNSIYDGFDIIKEVKRRELETRLIIHSAYNNLSHARKAFTQGSDGYVTKNGGKSQIYQAIDTVISGAKFVSEDLKEDFVMSNLIEPSSSMTCTLTDREMEVAELTERGFTAREIGEKLHLSPRTIDSHRRAIKQKKEHNQKLFNN